MGPIWGIDLGGTKIEGVILEDWDNPRILQRTRIPTEASFGYEHVIYRITHLIEVLTTQTGLKPSVIGLATPGVIDPITGLMKNSNTTALNGKRFKKDLERALNIPIKTANDANCFAIAETRMGAVKEAMPEAKVTFGVIMGTGVGGGIVVEGKAIYGRHGIGGEWGHTFLDESGGDCYCGNVGCVETILSGPSLERYYKSLTGIPLKLQEIIKLAEAGENQAAIQTVDRLIHFFGKGLANVINILDPDAIILGGGLANIDFLYTRGVDEIKKHIFNSGVINTRFLKPKLGDSAGVFGAAML